MSDAAHLLSDLGTLCMSLLTLTYAAKRAPATHSFGLHRAELLGALFSVASLWAVTGALLVAAAQRLRQPERVQGQAMMAIALLGVVVNVALAAVLSGAQGHGHSHGGLRGAEGACDGRHGDSAGHGHSHGAGADCCGDEEDEEAGLLPRGGGGSTGELRMRGSCGGGGCGHSHGDSGGSSAPRPPLAPLRLGAPEAPAGEAQPPPAPAVFFTRGRMPAPGSGKGSSASLVSDDGDVAPGGTVPPALAAAVMAASRPPPSPRQPRGSGAPTHRRSGSGGTTAGPVWSGGCGGEATDVNMRGAYLHVLADLAQSCGVAVAGLIIWARPSLRWLDPACTLAFSAAVLVASSRLLRDVVDVIMERTPRGVDAAGLAADLAALPGVAGVHDLHVWALMPGKLLLTVHLEAAPGARARDVLRAAQRVAHRRLGVAHATIQVEGAA